MSAMPNRPDLPSQPSLFDAAPAAEPAAVATTTGLSLIHISEPTRPY